ncbi:MAG: radical SAM protein [bacterium]|nr:radical SAM protein [bacterium]
MTLANSNPTRALFIEAPYSYGSAEGLVGSYFPLGLGYLAAWLKQHGYAVDILQPDQGQSVDEALQAKLESFKPTLVGISVMTPSYPQAVNLCEMIKKSDPSRKTVLGGHHISAVGGEVLDQSPNTDFVVIGEGEQTLLELAEALQAGKSDMSEISGLGWRDETGKTRINAPREFITDMDSLPHPARELVDMNRFAIHSYIDFGKRSATMVTSRGCPFKCIFCSSWLAMGSRYRWRSADSVLAEIRELVEVHKVDHIVFEDDTMTLRRSRMVEICNALIDMPNSPSWYCLSRVDTMDRELAKLMRKAGCRMVNFGIESGSPEILKKIGKKISLDKAVDAISACTRAGLRTQCTFIVGFPFDTDETMELTYKTACRIKPTIAMFFPLTPYPGTSVFNEFMDPSLAPKTVGEWDRFIMTSGQGSISVNPDHNGKSICGIADRWNRRFFRRPTQWFRMLRTVSSVGEFMRLAKGGLYLISTMFRK